MNKFLIISLLCFLFYQGKSQVVVNGKIIFTNANDSLNNIGGISEIDSLDEGLRHKDFLYSTFFDEEININDSVLEINPGYEFPGYQIGMMITISIPILTDTIFTPDHIKIGNHPIVPLKNIFGQYITNEVIKKNVLLMLLFDGNNFIAVNNDTRTCPSGFKKMNDSYCIQINRNSNNYFWQALQTCMNAGNHLCNIEEWTYACFNNAGLVNMPLNYEWVHSTSNHNYYAFIIGNGTCIANNSGDTTPIPAVLKYRYRCCYSLR